MWQNCTGWWYLGRWNWNRDWMLLCSFNTTVITIEITANFQLSIVNNSNDTVSSLTLHIRFYCLRLDGDDWRDVQCIDRNCAMNQLIGSHKHVDSCLIYVSGRGNFIGWCCITTLIWPSFNSSSPYCTKCRFSIVSTRHQQNKRKRKSVRKSFIGCGSTVLHTQTETHTTHALCLHQSMSPAFLPRFSECGETLASLSSRSTFLTLSNHQVSCFSFPYIPNATEFLPIRLKCCSSMKAWLTQRYNPAQDRQQQLWIRGVAFAKWAV